MLVTDVELQLDLTTYVDPTKLAVISDHTKLQQFIAYAQEHLSPEQRAYVKENFQFNITPIRLTSTLNDPFYDIDSVKAEAVKTVVNEVATRLNVTPLQACTALQASAARKALETKDESVLDALCAYKWTLIEQAGLL